MTNLGKNKLFFLIITTIWGLSVIASANTCTDAWFKVAVTPYVGTESGSRIDSSYFNEYGDNEWTHKYIYENGKIIQMKYDTKEPGEEIKICPFYHDVDETALKNKGLEYIVSNCSTLDTICYKQKVYSEGKYEGIKITKKTPNYASDETIESSTHWFTEYFIKSDSIIIKEYFDYNTDSVRTSQKIYAADPNDDNKCYQYDAKGQIDYTYLYKPNENGFSISVESETYYREFFFVETKESIALRKTFKPVKISPKARYFDLLGRFKFSK